MRHSVPNVHYHYIKLCVRSKSKNDANELNLYKVLKDSMNNWFGDIDGVDTSNWTTIWLKDHKEVILKVLASEAHKILNSISMHSC
ncbi:hypothetical protein PCANC_09684 [Puccinia coronata f. sp. avenae]|nr:hypothetical protein PCANC_14151 [Puccinia coronata f. sp. avenae]PLW47120.1 hypothetical protein PCANC_09684 [Puccinia coronata f. sp. avenae]